MKLFILFILFFNVMVAQAEEVTTQVSNREYPIGYFNCKWVNKLKSYKQFGFADKCDDFLRATPENPIPLCRDFLHAIEKSARHCFIPDENKKLPNPKIFSHVCPKYKKFSVPEKMEFVLFVFAAIAHRESSCDIKAEAQGVNDVADGLMQLEYSRKQRKDAGRDEKLCVTDSAVDTKSVGFQFNCAAAIFRDGYCKPGKKVGVDRFYWHELNLKRHETKDLIVNGEITKVLKKFPGCK